MKTRSPNPLHGVSITSVKGDLVEITDATEITALERRIRAERKIDREKSRNPRPR